MSKLEHFYIYFTSLIVIAVDFFSKDLIIDLDSKHLLPQDFGPFLRIDLVYNKGVSFGLFQQFHYANLLFASLAFILVLILAFWQHSATTKLEKLALAFIIGGAIGNFIDRISYKAVVDFIIFHWQNHAFPVFNIADSAISLGVGAILLMTLFSKTNNKVG